MPRCASLCAWMILGGIPCLAAEEEPGVHFGVQITAAAPLQDFRAITGRTGAGAGVFLEQDLEGGVSLRTRFDYVVFGEARARTQDRLGDLVAPQALRVAVNLASLGVELRFQPVGLGPVFLLGGLTGFRAEFTSILPGQIQTQEKTSVKLGLALGAGYRFSSACTLSLRATTTRLGGATLGTLEGGVDYRF